MYSRIAWISLIALVVALLAAVFILPGCAGKSAPPEKAATGDSAADPTAPDEPAAEAPTNPMEDPLYTPTYKPNGKEVAVIKTAKGVIKFTFYPEDAPNHVAAYIELAQKGFYDGTKFHRVEPGFVIQGGDPLSKTDDPMVGTGGPDYRLGAEFNSRKHLDGTVAMARSQSPDSAGSQFYICLGAQQFLDGQYTVFGQVTEGMDVVRSITVGDVMESVTIENAN